MSESVRLRHLAEINPATAAFDVLDADDLITFMPLETVWADSRCEITRVRPKSEVSSGYVRFQAGDILSPKVTPTFQAGRSALLTEIPSSTGAASTEVHVVRANKGRADPRYLRYGLLSKPFLDEGVSRFQGVAGLQRVPEEFLRDFRVFERSLDEQRRIADFLDDQVVRIDNIIAARAKQMQLDDMALTAELRYLVLVGPTVPARRFFREAVVGIVVQPARFYVEPGEPGIPALRGLNLAERTISTDSLIRISEDGHAMHPRSRLHPGDIVAVRTGDAGAACIVPDWADDWNAIDLVIIRANAAAIPEYLVHAFNANRRSQSIAAASSGSIQQHFGVNAIGDLPVVFRDLVEQSKVSKAADEAYSRHHERSDLLLQSIDLYQELKRSLITAAVSGEFDVSTADGSQVPA